MILNDNRPAGGHGKAATTNGGQRFQYDFQHSSMREWVNTTPGVFRPHFLDFCVDDHAIYLEEPAARRAMNGRYEHVAFNLVKWEGTVCFISAADLERRGRYVTDRTGDRLWRVPRRTLKTVAL